MAKVKIPKRVGGVKVPRKLRKKAKKALDLVDSRAARELAMAGLAIAAENVIVRGRARSGNGKRLQDVIKEGLDGLEFGEMLRAAAAEGARRFLEGFEEIQRATEPAEPAKPARPARPAKPAKSASPAKKPAKSGAPARKPARKKPTGRRSGAAAG